MNKHIKFAVLATDIAVLTTDGENLKVLLTRAKSSNFKGIPCIPGGLIEPKETAEVAAKRILEGSLGIADYYTEQLYTFDKPGRDPAGRVVSVANFVLVPWNKGRIAVKNGAWWESVNNLPSLAYDHNEVVKTAVKRLRGKITYTNIVYSLMPAEFTLTELQSVYESILGKKLDKRNFRKKIESLKLLVSTGKLKKGGATRPARLYSFKKRTLQPIEIL